MIIIIKLIFGIYSIKISLVTISNIFQKYCEAATDVLNSNLLICAIYYVVTKKNNLLKENC